MHTQELSWDVSDRLLLVARTGWLLLAQLLLRVLNHALQLIIIPTQLVVLCGDRLVCSLELGQGSSCLVTGLLQLLQSSLKAGPLCCQLLDLRRMCDKTKGTTAAAAAAAQRHGLSSNRICHITGAQV